MNLYSILFNSNIVRFCFFNSISFTDIYNNLLAVQRKMDRDTNKRKHYLSFLDPDYKSSSVDPRTHKRWNEIRIKSGRNRDCIDAAKLQQDGDCPSSKILLINFMKISIKFFGLTATDTYSSRLP